tara:strand:- start:157 stop:342 length:186 start_codon:yes stop_codon:yes gene_type:complete
MNLTHEQMSMLRESKVISEEEVAIKEGDLIVAKNVVTQARRIIGKVDEILVESTQRRVLKG